MAAAQSPPERVTPPDASPAWHALEVAEVYEKLQTSPRGLSDEEASVRLEQYGPNELPAPRRKHPLLRFMLQFNSTVILFLLSAAVVAALLRHWVDALVIVVVVTVNAIVGFVQEGRAERALQSLQSLLSPRARVVRNQQRCLIPVREVVPGDLVVLEAEDRAPADLRLVRARGLLVDEAILTGESVAAEKTVARAPRDASLGDRHCNVYSGTLVVAGRGVGVVANTGLNTELGRISTLVASVESLTTPLLKQIENFGRRFSAFVIATAALLFVFAITVHAYEWPNALMVVLALAVGIVPEGLPAVITITLAIGVQRMATRHAIIRRLPAVETLGATSVICSDKTGTLTQNEMTARHVHTASAKISVTGSGYAPAGTLSVPLSERPERLLQAAVLCNTAQLTERDGNWHVDGDPMEGALLALAMKAGIEPSELRTACPKIDEIPFDSQHRFMATLHRASDGSCELFVKGAPERVLAMSTRQLDDSNVEMPLQPEHWNAVIQQAAMEGERVLAFATRRLSKPDSELDFHDVRELVFLGLVTMVDPPREEAVLAVRECRSAGIMVKMITGDHALTAGAIARQLGLAENPEVITGPELDMIPDADLPDVAARVSVFARTSPEHKLRVVRALQAKGAVVAMTGDGVNDAPALKQADVGIAMGGSGTEAAKEASEMVLTDDNFASIVAAVHEGRTVYDNIRKVIAWTLPTNGGEALAVVVALVFGLTLPMTPVQILWINMVLTVTLGLVLAFEPPEPNVMRHPPRRKDEPLMSPFMLWRVVFVSIAFMVGSLGIFAWARSRGFDLQTSRTMVVNALCVMETFYLFNVRYMHMTSLTLRALRGTRAVLMACAAVIVAQFAFTYAPFMQAVFDTGPVPFWDGVLIVSIGPMMLFLFEIEKSVLRSLGVFRELQRTPLQEP